MLSRFSLAAALTALLWPALVRGQRASAAAVLADVSQGPLGEFVGGTLRFTSGRPDQRVAFRLSAEHLVGVQRRTTVLCPGPGSPRCPAEPLRDAATISSLTGGVATRLVRTPRAALALVVDAGVAYLRADTRALTTGRVLSATRVHGAGMVGFLASVAPVRRWPVALEVGGSVGGSMPLMPNTIVDGYTPLNDGFTVRRASLGLAWRGL
jgi:hypothetical protein